MFLWIDNVVPTNSVLCSIDACITPVSVFCVAHQWRSLRPLNCRLLMDTLTCYHARRIFTSIPHAPERLPCPLYILHLTSLPPSHHQSIVFHSALPATLLISSSVLPIFTTLYLIIRGSKPSVRLTACCVLALESNLRMK